MSKDKDFLRLEGVVTQKLRGACKVALIEGGYQVHAPISGRMMLRKIAVAVGDEVTVELSPYDLKRGRIVRRTPFVVVSR
jgi:translation initiation factor IF-1